VVSAGKQEENAGKEWEMWGNGGQNVKCVDWKAASATKNA